MILLIDNQDSFVYNLAHALECLGFSCCIFRNDAIDCAQIAAMQPSHLVFSPGPGRPESAGILLECILHFQGQIPMLGVCLGHQAIAKAFGGHIIRAKTPMHGKASAIRHSQRSIFKGLPSPLSMGRYHSLIVDPQDLPPCLEILALDETDQIMALKHRLYPIYGIQFHPESILSPQGNHLLQRFFENSVILKPEVTTL